MTNPIPDALDSAGLIRWMVCFADALDRSRETINRLNVYPVPDGDTGTNMYLTVEAVRTDLHERAEDGPLDIESACETIAKASLMGARGNSGVIMSQLLRALTSAFTEHESTEVGPTTLAVGLESAARAAYKAVMEPTEGTILTVARCSASAAVSAAEEGGSLLSVTEAARAEAERTLIKTPEMLAVLAKAGVVDAGGTGLVVMYDALLNAIDGRAFPPVVGGHRLAADSPVDNKLEAGLEGDGTVATSGAGDVGHVDEDGESVQRGETSDHDDASGFRYEVMFLLDANDDSVQAFRDVWASVGDSIVIVGGEGLWNCHIHTDDVGAAIEAGIDAGRPSRIRVSDLHEEVAEERWVREASAAQAAGSAGLGPNHDAATAIVSVSPGDGISRIFNSLGVAVNVAGGQTMNPSVAELAEAVGRLESDGVIILPNNSNIVSAAKEVNAHSEKNVEVVPTRGVVEGFAALLAYDPEEMAKENCLAMTDAAESVLAAEVTVAVRSSSCDLGDIGEGDYIALVDGEIVAIAPSATGALISLLESHLDEDHEIVSVIEGEAATEATTRRLRLWIEESRPDVAVEVHHGGQRNYPYYLGIE